nr:hypothetical protein [Tanacetum cinerariifolium]
MQRGITVSYENWIHYGEPYDDLDDSDDDMPICEDSEGDNDMNDEDLGEMLNNIVESRGGVNWHSSGESPYILASQAKQVFYAPDIKLGKSWLVVDSNAPRALFDVSLRDEEVYQDQELYLYLIDDLNIGLPSLARGDVPLEVVDESKIGDNSSKKSTQNMHPMDKGFIDDDYDDDDDDDDDDDGDEDDDADDIDSTGAEYSENKNPSEDDCSDWE